MLVIGVTPQRAAELRLMAPAPLPQPTEEEVLARVSGAPWTVQPRMVPAGTPVAVAIGGVGEPGMVTAVARVSGLTVVPDSGRHPKRRLELTPVASDSGLRRLVGGPHPGGRMPRNPIQHVTVEGDGTGICRCGCGTSVGAGSSFAPGHDQALLWGRIERYFGGDVITAVEAMDNLFAGDAAPGLLDSP